MDSRSRAIVTSVLWVSELELACIFKIEKFKIEKLKD